MSWRFDRPDFQDLESHSGCRSSGRDGRYVPPSEVTPLIVVLHVGSHLSMIKCVRRHVYTSMVERERRKYSSARLKGSPYPSPLNAADTF